MSDELASTELIEWMTEVAHRDETDLSDLGREELADLWVRCDALRTIVASVQRKVEERLAPMLKEAPVLLSDGTVLKHKPTASRTGWRNAELLEQVLQRATVNIVDASTGERVALVDPTKVRGLLEPTHALTKLRAVGIDYTAYCTEQWTEKVEAHR